jgi:hypothetical protein
MAKIIEDPKNPSIVTIQLNKAEQERLPNRPVQNIRINRYMSVDKFFSLIDNGAIWFNRLDNFSDEHEGRSIIEWITAEGDQDWWRKSTLASCWNWDYEENFALWNIYLNRQTEGICIVSTRDDFLSAIEESNDREEVEDYFVKYVPYGETYPGINYPICATRKYNWYRYEKEYRFIIYVGSSFDQKGKLVRMNPSTLIKGLILSPDMSADTQAKIEEKIKSIGLEIEIINQSVIRDKLV